MADIFLKKIGYSTRNKIIGYALLNRETCYTLQDIAEGLDCSLEDIVDEIKKLVKGNLLIPNGSSAYRLNKDHKEVSKLARLHDELIMGGF